MDYSSIRSQYHQAKDAIHRNEELPSRFGSRQGGEHSSPPRLQVRRSTFSCHSPLTPYDRAGSIECATFLLENRADVKAVNMHRFSPLHCATHFSDSAPLLKLLIQKQAEVGATDQNGWTALHMAAAKGNLEQVTALFEAGADVNATTLANQSAILMASCNGHSEVVRFLLKNGTARHFSACVPPLTILPVQEETRSFAQNSHMKVLSSSHVRTVTLKSSSCWWRQTKNY